MPSLTRRAFLGACAAVGAVVARVFPESARTGDGDRFVIVNGWIVKRFEVADDRG